MYGDEIRGLKRGKWLIMRAYHNPFIGNIPRYPHMGNRAKRPLLSYSFGHKSKSRYGSANSIMQQLGVVFCLE